MAAVPTLEQEDARRPTRERESLVGERTRVVNRMRGCLARLGIRGFKPTLRRAPERLDDLRTPEGVALPPNTLAELRRDMARLRFITDQIREVEDARAERIERAPAEGANAMVRLLARVVGVGVETADMLVHEVLSRRMRDRRAVARYAGLTGAPDESGAQRREKGLAKAGNARVRRGMIQLAWRFLRFQEASALAQWYRARSPHRGPGEKAAHRLMAVRHNRRGAGRPHPARRSSKPPRRGARQVRHRRKRDRLPMTVRGGGNPLRIAASTPNHRCVPQGSV